LLLRVHHAGKGRSRRRALPGYQHGQRRKRYDREKYRGLWERGRHRLADPDKPGHVASRDHASRWIANTAAESHHSNQRLHPSVNLQSRRADKDRWTLDGRCCETQRDDALSVNSTAPNLVRVMIMKRIKLFDSGERGATLVEFAIALSVFLTAMFA